MSRFHPVLDNVLPIPTYPLVTSLQNTLQPPPVRVQSSAFSGPNKMYFQWGFQTMNTGRLQAHYDPELYLRVHYIVLTINLHCGFKLSSFHLGTYG